MFFWKRSPLGRSAALVHVECRLVHRTLEFDTFKVLKLQADSHEPGCFLFQCAESYRLDKHIAMPHVAYLLPVFFQVIDMLLRSANASVWISVVPYTIFHTRFASIAILLLPLFWEVYRAALSRHSHYALFSLISFRDTPLRYGVS